MMPNVREYILDALQKEYSFKTGESADNINYVEEGYMDSLGIIQFIADIEETFGIEFTDDEMVSSEFKVVGSLIQMIERKLGN